MVSDEITRLIGQAMNGDAVAENQLCEQVYGELHAMARRIMSHDDTSLQPTLLVGKLFEKFFRNNGLKKAASRRYFFAVAASQMRNMLVDHYRRQKTRKRGGDRTRESLDVALDKVLVDFESSNQTTMESLDLALDHLRAQNQRQYEVVMQRFFVGLTQKQTAELLNIDEKTVKQDWTLARAKLRACLND